MEKKPQRKKTGSAKKRPARKPSAQTLSRLKTRKVRRHLTNEFKPDAPLVSAWKPLRFTQLQRLQVIRWSLYVLVFFMSIIMQDSMLSRFSFLKATTDLPAGVLMTVAILEGAEIGSTCVLIGSVFYYFSGSSPGPYCVALLTLLGMTASMLRQVYLHRSGGSIIICASVAVTVYEISLYLMGLFLGLTYWTRLPVFFMTGVLTSIAIIPIYKLYYRIGLIGGDVWKE